MRARRSRNEIARTAAPNARGRGELGSIAAEIVAYSEAPQNARPGVAQRERSGSTGVPGRLGKRQGHFSPPRIMFDALPQGLATRPPRTSGPCRCRIRGGCAGTQWRAGGHACGPGAAPRRQVCLSLSLTAQIHDAIDFVTYKLGAVDTELFQKARCRNFRCRLNREQRLAGTAAPPTREQAQSGVNALVYIFRSLLGV